MAHYLNNHERRDHKALFGSDAFFDLDQEGSQARYHARFHRGDYCVVLSRADGDMVKLTWHQFAGFRDAVDDRGNRVRVLFGRFEKQEVLSKEEAAGHRLYHPFFDKNGSFKRGSVF